MKKFAVVIFMVMLLVLVSKTAFEDHTLTDIYDYSEVSASDVKNYSPEGGARKGGFSIRGLIPGISRSVVQQKRKDYSSLVRDIEAYLSDREGTYGIHFLSLTTNQRFGINDTELFCAASTTKVPINLYLYRKIVRKEISPETIMEYTEEDYEEGTGSIQYNDFGMEYTLRELSSLSIIQSDNVAINMLVRYLGWDNVKKFMEQVLKREVDLENNLFSPRDMTIFLKAVHDFGKRYKDDGGELLSFLKNTEFNDRIPLYLPEGTEVAHKIGTQVRAFNDIGIVYSEKPFILSIMSSDVNEEEAPEVIATIAKMVYDYENQ